MGNPDERKKVNAAVHLGLGTFYFLKDSIAICADNTHEGFAGNQRIVLFYIIISNDLYHILILYIKEYVLIQLSFFIDKLV